MRSRMGGLSWTAFSEHLLLYSTLTGVMFTYRIRFVLLCTSPRLSK